MVEVVQNWKIQVPDNEKLFTSFRDQYCW